MIYILAENALDLNITIANIPEETSKEILKFHTLFIKILWWGANSSCSSEYQYLYI